VDSVEVSIRRYCFGGVVVVDGADEVVAGGFVADGIEGSMGWLRGQNTAATITTAITATIAYQKRLSPKKFIAISLILSGAGADISGVQ
jgi:hypothetical protein